MRHHHLYATNGNVPEHTTTTTDNTATVDTVGGLGTTTATTNNTTDGGSVQPALCGASSSRPPRLQDPSSYGS